MIKNKEMIFVVGIFGWLFLVGSGALAEPQFGGDVSSVIPCTCGSNEGGFYFEVDDPHGNDSGGHGEYVAGPGVFRDCAPIQNGEETLGMHNENDEDCKQITEDGCQTVVSGKGVDIYGTSPSTCDTGLDGDASGDEKIEMITPDGRTADGGDEDDGGPSGGASNATQNDTPSEASSGVKADGSGGAVHMITPDNQDSEGEGTNHMVITSDNNRDYEGHNDTVMVDSGNDSGYGPAGAGRAGHGYGSVGGGIGVSGSSESGECPDSCSATVAGITEQCSVVANGGRPHFRFGSPGGVVCPGTCTVVINCGGQSESYVINNGANRDDRGGFLWKPVSESSGNLVILAPSSMAQEDTSVLGSMDEKNIFKGKEIRRPENSKNKKGLLVGVLVSISFVGAGYFTTKAIRKVFK